MPFEKGRKKTGGKKRGYTFDETKQAQEAIANLVNLNTPNMIKWLDEIAQNNPKDAFDCLVKIMEYHLPKLNRSDFKMQGMQQSQIIYIDSKEKEEIENHIDSIVND